MKIHGTRALATLEWALVLPAALFMTALFVRNIQPSPYQPAEAARQLVDWFSARRVLGLDICLVTLPFTALVIGCATVLRRWRRDAELRRVAFDLLAILRAQAAILLIGAATFVAGGVLAIVALHMITE